MVATQSAKALWYLSRGTGLVSLVLLSASVLLGVTEVVRWANERWPRFVTAALHRNVSLLATAFIGVHVVTAVLDGFAPIRWLDVVVPFTCAYRPVWLGLGAVAVDLLIALVVTSLLRQRIGPRAWRAVHWAAYACWPVAVVHGLGTGSDTRAGWVQLLDAACVGAVVLAVWWRVATGWPVATGRRIAAASASVMVPLGILAWTAIGPARAGWARRAGTPASLLASAAPARTASSGSDAPATARRDLSPPFTAQLTGRIDERDQPDGGATITIDASLSQGATGRLQLVLQGEAVAGGGVRMSGSSVILDDVNGRALYRGRVTALDGGFVAARVTGSDGRAVALSIRLRIDDGSNAVGGVVQGAAA